MVARSVVSLFAGAVLLVGCAAVDVPTAPGRAPALSRGGAPTHVDPTPDIAPIPSEVCGFPVQIAFGGKAKVIALPGGGTLLTSPGYAGTVTNLATGRSETLSVTGAFHVAPQPNGDVEVVFTGRNLLALDAAAGGPLYVVASGRFTIVVNAADEVVRPLQGSGRLTDVCALLS